MRHRPKTPLLSVAPPQAGRAAGARLAAGRRSVVLRSAATDEIIEKMKTLTVRSGHVPAPDRPSQGFWLSHAPFLRCGPRVAHHKTPRLARTR